MAMSKKLTFSLASLVLILGLVFVTTPVMAQALLDVPITGADADGIPANGYLIVRKTADTQVGTLDPAEAISVPATTLPDLEDLFFDEGGTIILTVGTSPIVAADGSISGGLGDLTIDHDGDDDGTSDFGAPAHAEAEANDGIKDDVDPQPDEVTATTNPATPKRNIVANDFAITEIMWALDNADKGTDTQDDHQWIEIYNRLSVPIPQAIANSLVLKFTTGRPIAVFADVAPVLATATADPAVVAALGTTMLDRISNVGGGGWSSVAPGQNGFTDDTTIANRIEFISMYRQRDKLGPNGGNNRAHWHASTNIYFSNYKGTPGAKERSGPKTFATTVLARSPFIFNEIGNSATDDYDWIELRNVTDATQNLKNRRISIIKSGSPNTDVALVTFPDKNINVAAGGVFLVVKTDPSDNDAHPLAAGFNIDKAADLQVAGVPADHPVRYIVLSDLALPDGGFVLALRGNNNDHLKTATGVIDVAGYAADLKVDTAALFTNLWPLVNFAAPWNGTHGESGNNFEADEVFRRQHAGTDGTSATRRDRQNQDDSAFRQVGWTGLGYKRNAAATAANGGTPGYDNGAVKSEGADVMAGASVIISEIMYVSGDRNLVQWIELYNTSKSIGVNIDNWSIFIVNHDQMDAEGTSFGGKLSERIDLDGKIPPGQTYLITGSTGRNDTNLPKERIHNSGKKRTEMLLSPYGFQVTLKAKTNEGDAAKHQTVDMVGNLGEAPENSRRADAQSFEPVAWELPAGVTDEGDRISIVRVSDAGVAADGTTAGAWVSFDMSGQIDQIIDPTSYGHSTDISSPGHTAGGILPVSLSKFRPERMKDTGAVVIRWVTESETNNAGFNILRSDTRDGEFTKLNTKLIAGQGTTSERTVYEYADTSAKPNVIYYYQIQDVSLDGQVTPLAITHLRGNVTAAGKLTTTWAELKSQD